MLLTTSPALAGDWAIIDSQAVFQVEVRGQKIWAGFGNRLTYSENNGDSWSRYDTTNGFGRGAISCLFVNDTAVWSATYFDTLFYGREFFIHGGFFRNDPEMTTWTALNNPGGQFPGHVTYDIDIESNVIWTANWWSSLRRSTDGGMNWTLYNPEGGFFLPRDRPAQRIFSVAVRDTVIWAGSEAGLHLSINSGATWNIYNFEMGQNSITGDRIICLQWRETGSVPELWAGSWTAYDTGQVSGLSITTDLGASWRTIADGRGIWSIVFHETDAFLATDSGLLYSNDDGQTFSNLTDASFPIGTKVLDVAIAPDSTLWIGTAIGLYRGDYQGAAWEKIDPILLDVPVDNSSLPGVFEIGQNIPNPFNPSTTIPVRLERRSALTLAVYDLLGRQRKLLADGHYSAGNHRFVWDGTDENGGHLPTGIYLYRVQADGFTQTRKMLLLK